MKELNQIHLQILQMIFEVYDKHYLKDSKVKSEVFLTPLIELIETDLNAYVSRDPAAQNHPYVLDSYLTFKAVLWYRVAHALLTLDQSFITVLSHFRV